MVSKQSLTTLVVTSHGIYVWTPQAHSSLCDIIMDDMIFCVDCQSALSFDYKCNRTFTLIPQIRSACDQRMISMWPVNEKHNYNPFLLSPKPIAAVNCLLRILFVISSA